VRVVDTGTEADVAKFDLVGVVNTFRVNQNGTTTPLVEITARSVKYDCQYTWDITLTTFQDEGAPNSAQQVTTEVNYIASLDHVQAIRSEADQDASGTLYNYLVVTVGTDDLTQTTDVSIRMDRIGTPAAFKALDTAWASLAALGAS
jgi:hypothetical protein